LQELSAHELVVATMQLRLLSLETLKAADELRVYELGETDMCGL